jgi:hypothetical protein
MRHEFVVVVKFDEYLSTTQTGRISLNLANESRALAAINTNTLVVEE